MSGEFSYAKQLVADAMQKADNDAHLDRDIMGRAIMHAVVEFFQTYRSKEDIASEMQYLIENINEDEFVITRGC